MPSTDLAVPVPIPPIERRLAPLLLAALIPILAACGGAGGSEGAGTPAATTATASGSATPAAPGVPVVVGGREVGRVFEAEGTLSASERADLIARRLEAVVNNPFRPDPEVTVVETDRGSDLLVDEQLILTVTDADAALRGVERRVVAAEVADRMRTVIAEAHSTAALRNRVQSALQMTLLLAVFAGAVWLIQRLYHRLLSRVEAWHDAREAALGPEDVTTWASHVLHRVSLLGLNLARWLLLLFLGVTLVTLALNLMPRTRWIFERAMNLVREPLARLWETAITYLPDLVTILVILMLSGLLVRAIRRFFLQIERRTLRVRQFDPEWAPLTKNLLTTGIAVLTAVAIFPLIPGSDSEIFRGIGVFVGLVLSLASSSALANIIAGITLTYTGAYRSGDLVQLGATTGFVIEKRLMTTRVRTFKNEEVSVPNSVVLGSAITNYSVLARQQGLILHTEVTIGYEVPWKEVQGLLLAAARATPGILAAPAPFVLQKALNDFHVGYELNAYTAQAEQMPRLMSALHAAIRDAFDAAGVEILSPAYASLRDGNPSTIPGAASGPGYRAPGFRVEVRPGDERVASAGREDGPPAP